MTVVGIDTASRVGGVAVVRDGKVLAQQVLGVQEGHSENVIASLASVMDLVGLDAREVDGLAVAIGPGSFTGLRIGVAVVKGLAYAWNIPVIGVSTLQALAWSLAGVDGLICASLDARRASVFCAFFEGGRIEGRGDPKDDEAVEEARVAVDDVARRIEAAVRTGKRVYLVGDGSQAVYETLGERMGSNGVGRLVIRMPMDGEAQRAANVAHLGERGFAAGRKDDPFDLVPNYLRRSEAERRWRQKRS